MPQRPLVNMIGEWLIDQALSEPDILTMFQQTCRKLDAAGIPVARARLTWQTLHPLFRAETLLWHRGEEIEFEQFRHRDEASDEWLRSPMKYMFDAGVDVMRRNLDGPNERVDFPILKDLKTQGLTDYLVVLTGLEGQTLMTGEALPFRRPGVSAPMGAGETFDREGRGIIVTWASDRPGGFSDDDITALQNIQRRFAVAVKTVIQRRIARNVAETYLGGEAGRQVLSGAIKLGDGRRMEAVIFYADMRNSTPLADTMEPEAFLGVLNEYFVHTAGAVEAEGGEVLDFVGDAILGVFPYVDTAGKRDAAVRARRAMQRAFAEAEEANREREAAGRMVLRFGVALHAGEVTFGNIGIPSRLAFAAIGSPLNEAARIEHLTKAVDANGLASAEVAALEPDAWRSVGEHRLTGVSQPCELFALAEADAAVRPVVPERQRLHA